MTLANRDLIERFLDGRESGKASRMEIRTRDGYRLLVGYGWAIYAADLGDKFALFGDGYKTNDTHVGWAGYSGTTTGHLQDIKRMLEERDEEYIVVDHQTEYNDFNLDAFDIEERAEAEEVEPRETTGYLYRQ